jgi:hypothetical protein
VQRAESRIFMRICDSFPKAWLCGPEASTIKALPPGKENDQEGIEQEFREPAATKGREKSGGRLPACVGARPAKLFLGLTRVRTG